MTDLWPKEFNYTQVKAPVTILKEQAALLGQKTKNLLEAKVLLHTDTGLANVATGIADQIFGDGKSKSFHYAFYFVAPTLNNYRYRFFTMSYDIQLYPVFFDVDEDLQLEIVNGDTKKAVIANSEEELIEILRKIFNADKTMRILQSILAQIEFEPG